MTRGYKYRIYPNATQRSLLERIFGCCRFVHNHFLALRRDEWKANQHSVTYKDTSRLLTEMKRREETSWLKEADSMALQEALRNLDAAFQNFFQKRARYPRFHSKHAHQQSYRTRNQKGGIRFVGNRLKLPKVGLVRIRKSRDFDGRILHATVSRTASGKYFVSICIEEDASFAPCGKGSIGIDVGLKAFCTMSDGTEAKNPKYLPTYQKKLARAQRRLSRTNENQVIAVEHLKIRNMLRNHRLARALSDASWSEFFRELGYKAAWRGAVIYKVDTFYPSSQTCSVCGYQNPLVKNLAVREWTCPKCGAHHDRDMNAAKNILAKALEGAS